MKVFVTGATGFVGPKIVHALREREHEVRALVRDRARGRQLEAWGAELAEGDVTDPESLLRGAEGCDALIHLVAILQGKPEDFERLMIRGGENVVEAARAAGVRRFVLMSALGTNEQTKDEVPYYGAKWAMEQAVIGSGLEYVIFRPSFVFGPGGGALRLFAKVARLSPVTPVIGDQRVQPIWIEDVAAFFAKSVDRDGVANRTWEIGGPDVVSWDELYRRIKRTLGVRRPSLRVPFAVAKVQATLLEVLPGPTPMNRDQVKMLAAGDNTCDVRPAVEAFDQTLVPLDEQLRRGLRPS